MKSVLRSIKSYYLYLILTGKKTIEVSKDFPKSPEWDRTVELYCSKDKKSFNRIPEADREWMRKYLGKVACRFVCDKNEEWNTTWLYGDDVLQKETCLNDVEIMDYMDDLLDCKFYLWHISAIKTYDKPKELGELKSVKVIRGYHPKNEVGMERLLHAKRVQVNYLTRPPQSWCYVEV